MVQGDDAAQQALLLEAMELQQAGELAAAERRYAAILSEQPSQPDAWHLLGLCAFHAGRFDDAESAIREAVAVAPHNPLFLCNLGLVLRAQGRPGLARESFLQSLSVDPEFALAHYNLGVSAFDREQYEEAAAHYRRAISANPDLRQAHYNLGLSLQRLLRDDEAISAYRGALDADPNYGKAWLNLANVYHRAQRWDDADAAYRRVVDLEPDHCSAQHMVSALAGTTTDGCPAEYVQQLFDSYAASFEAVLVGELDYRVPEALAQLVADDGPERRFAYALDLGCGTGLVGRALRSRCDRLVGVDLSPAMLAEAEQSGVYDELVTGELVSSLERVPPGFDLAVAGDVLTYLGDLAPFFSALGAHRSSLSRVAFSVESCATDDFALLRSGRYAHHPRYVAQLATQQGFEIRVQREAVLRCEYSEDVTGQLVLLAGG